jgi:hypothetical protein
MRKLSNLLDTSGESIELLTKAAAEMERLAYRTRYITDSLASAKEQVTSDLSFGCF